jgi:hypothetical protein
MCATLYSQYMGIRRVLFILFLFCAALSCCAQDQPCPKDGRPDCSRALEFFHKMQAALRNNDRKAIAGMMEYPFLTRVNHKKVHIRTRQQLLAHFDQIFDAGVRCEVLNATDDDVWGNYQGFNSGSGAVWFESQIPPDGQMDPHAPGFWDQGAFKIITVNNDSRLPCKKLQKEVSKPAGR